MSENIYNEFYVYAWLKKTGETYYIGKGKGQRAWRKGGGIVQIIASNLTEPEAFALEALLIKKIGRKDLNEGPLHNRNDGMIGGDTSKHPNFIKAMKSRINHPENFGDQSGKNNGMFGKGYLLKGANNGMHGTKRGEECTNKRLSCPLCDMKSNSSNIKRHISVKHKLDWKEVL